MPKYQIPQLLFVIPLFNLIQNEAIRKISAIKKRATNFVALFAPRLGLEPRTP